MVNPGCVVNPAVGEQREKAQIETPGSPVSKFEGNTLNFDSGLEISRDGIIHDLLPRGHWSQLCGVLHLQLPGSS